MISVAGLFVGLMLISMTGSLILLARIGWGFLFGLKHRPFLNFGLALLSLVIGSSIAIEFIDDCRLTFRELPLILIQALSILFVVFFLWISIFCLFQQGSGKQMRRVGWNWGWVICLSLVFPWSAVRFEQRLGLGPDYGLAEVSPGLVIPQNESIGVTDKGRHVGLYAYQVDAAMFREFASNGQKRFASYSGSLIVREEADRKANCHGWVFTNGQYLLRGEDIHTILEDNGYQSVIDPRQGDIVIYRDDFGIIRHTGLVQGVLGDGTILIESKWGIDQRFLHLPEDQPYSQIFTFYRTHRPNHLIMIDDHPDP